MGGTKKTAVACAKHDWRYRWFRPPPHPGVPEGLIFFGGSKVTPTGIIILDGSEVAATGVIPSLQ